MLSLICFGSELIVYINLLFILMLVTDNIIMITSDCITRLDVMHGACGV